MAAEAQQELVQRGAVSLVENASYVIVRDSVFGALLLLSVFALWQLIRVLLQVQDKRIQDLQEINRHVESREQKSEKLIQNLTEAINRYTISMERTESALRENTRAMNAVEDVLQRQSSILDSVVRDTMRSAVRRPSPTPDSDPPRRT